MSAYTIGEIATKLGVSARTIRREIEARRLGSIHVGRSVRITEVQLAEYIARQSSPALEVVTEAGRVVLRAVGGTEVSTTK